MFDSVKSVGAISVIQGQLPRRGLDTAISLPQTLWPRRNIRPSVSHKTNHTLQRRLGRALAEDSGNLVWSRGLDAVHARVGDGVGGIIRTE